MSMAVPPAAASKAVPKGRGYPWSFRAGMVTRPIAAVSAVAEPETPLKNIEASTMAAPSPPGIRPIRYLGEINQAFSKPAARHDRSGKDEQRNRQQRKAAEDAKDLLRQDEEKITAARRQIDADRTCQPQGERDRHAEEHHHEEYAQYDAAHAPPPSP